MSPSHGAITLAWADGEHNFNICAIGHLLELQDKCDAGPQEIHGRIVTGRWRVNDVRETLRLGLIGGGMAPLEALALVRRYVDVRPWFESVPIAAAVLGAALVGVKGDALGKPQAERTATEAATAASSAPLSTASAQPSDSIPAPSMQ